MRAFGKIKVLKILIKILTITYQNIKNNLKA